MPPDARRRRFPTTRWSQIIAAGTPASPASRAALASLCETYWSPVHDFVRHSARSADDAQDLTQAFFAQVLERGDFRHARPERGRFRTFLLTAVRHFLANQAEHDRAAKRGGGQAHLPIEPASPDEWQAFAPVASTATPETIFEERWAFASLDAAMARLESEYQRTGRQRLFDQLGPCLTGDTDASYADCAKALAMTEGAVRVAVHRMRQHFGRCLRETLAETVDDPADVDSELDYLLKVVSRCRQPAAGV
jgi:RNA polymerase sigma-70 factor (ECF subfamily)